MLLKNIKLVLGVILVVVIWYAGYKYGMFKIEARQLEVVKEYQEIQNNLTAKLYEKQQVIDKKTSVKVRTIYVQEDPTGCLNTDIPDGVYEALHSNPTRPDPS